jgi:hypothetical protein
MGFRTRKPIQSKPGGSLHALQRASGTAGAHRARTVKPAVFLVAVALVALVLVPGAVSFPASHNPITASDPSGDSGAGPDITTVAVSNTASKKIRFAISIANTTVLADSAFIGLFIDTDQNTANGSEYSIQTIGALGRIILGRWSGSEWVPVEAPSMVKTWTSGGTMTFEVSAADLGNPTRLTFWAVSETAPGEDPWDDLAPDGDATYQYTLSMPHIASLAARFSSVVARAGRPFVVTGVTLKLASDEEVAAASFRCRATLAGQVLRGKGAGGCTFAIPRSAKGKRLSLTITATYEGQSGETKSSLRIR